MIRIGYPIYSMASNSSIESVYASGGNGKENGVSIIHVTKKKQEILRKVEFPEIVSFVAAEKVNNKYIAIAVGAKIILCDSNLNEISQYSTNAKGAIFKGIEFSPDGRTLLVIDPDNCLHLLNVPGLTLLAKREASKKEDGSSLPSCAVFLEISPNEHYIALINELEFLLMRPNKDLTKLGGFNDVLSFVPIGMCSYGDVLIVTGNCTSINQSAIVELKIVDSIITGSRIVHPVQGIITSIASSRKTLAIGTKNGDVFLLNKISLGRLRCVRRTHEGPVMSLTSCNKVVVTGGMQGNIVCIPNHARPIQFIFLFSILVLSFAVFLALFKYINE